jgi:hypothetical protein
MNVKRFTKTSAVMTAMFLVLLAVQAGQAEPIVLQLTDNDTDDISPQVFGGHSVWQGKDPVGGDWEIYFYDGNSVSRLTDNTTADTKPQIFGKNIVWQGWDANGGDWEISAAVIPASMKMKITPQSLNLKSKGQWITCHLRLPNDLQVADVNVSSIRLQGEVAAAKVTAGKLSNQLVIKLDRAAVGALLTPGASVEITLTGQMNDGAWFEASDTIKVINPGH